MKKIHSLFLPAVVAGVTSLLSAGVASADNIFVANNGGNSIIEISDTNVVSTFASTNMGGPTGLAFDSQGHLYVANNSFGTVSEYDSTGTFMQYYATGQANPRGIAFDSAGNLYIADQSSGNLVEIPVGSPTGSTGTVVANGLNFPNGLSFDNSGNLYITSGGGSFIDKITFSSPGTINTVTPFVTSGLSSPNGIAFDTIGTNANNFFVVDHNTNSVLEVDASGNLVAPIPFIQAPAGDEIKALAIDSAGDFWVTDYGTASITEYNSAGQFVQVFSNPGDFLATSGIITQQVVPEPSTYALLIASLGVMFFVVRRRKLAII